jgi:hypothetical protein
MTRPVNRRSFLKLSAVGAAGWGLRPAWAAPAVPRLAATLRLPVPHRFVANPETLLTRLPAADLLLVPAYVAAGLIRRGWLQPLAGPAGRAHDPEGAYTIPYRYAVSALVHPPGVAPEEAWAEGVMWPAFSRLVMGAALQRRGYSPNDAHAGHLTLAAQDLEGLRPALTADPLAAVEAGSGLAAVALVPVTGEGEPVVPAGLAVTRPRWGGVLVEYDWVLPAGGSDPDGARAYLAGLTPAALPIFAAGRRLPPLAPLPERSQALHTRLWADLTRSRREAGA